MTPDPASVAAGEALSAVEEATLRRRLLNGNIYWIGPLTIGRLIATLDAARSGPASPGEGLDVERLSVDLANDLLDGEDQGLHERYLADFLIERGWTRLATEPQPTDGETEG